MARRGAAQLYSGREGRHIVMVSSGTSSTGWFKERIFLPSTKTPHLNFCSLSTGIGERKRLTGVPAVVESGTGGGTGRGGGWGEIRQFLDMPDKKQ